MNVAIKVKKPFLKFWLNKKGKVIPDDVARGLNPDREKKERQQQEKEEAIFCHSWASSSVRQASDLRL